MTYRNMGLEIGDRVIVVVNSPEGNDSIKKGYTGRIIWLYPEDDWVSVEFDQKIMGHDGDGRGKNGYCWNMPGRCVELYSDYYDEAITIDDVNSVVDMLT